MSPTPAPVLPVHRQPDEHPSVVPVGNGYNPLPGGSDQPSPSNLSTPVSKRDNAGILYDTGSEGFRFPPLHRLPSIGNDYLRATGSDVANVYRSVGFPVPS